MSSRWSRALALVLVIGSVLVIGNGAPSQPAALAAPKALHGIIVVNELNQDVSTNAGCSLPEAIFAANFDANLAIDPSNLNGPKITTGCAAGSGADTIVLPANAVILMGVNIQDQFNPVGLTATPSVTSTITIQGNGARLERTGALNIRAFMVNQQLVPEVSNANGNLTIQNLHIKGFRAQGGNGFDGGGGGLGAGGAIYNRNGVLTVENSTFEGNNATGGAGGAVSAIAGGGGGGGMSSSATGGNDVALGAANAGGGGGGARGNGGDGANSGGGGGGTANNGTDGGAGVGGNGGFNCGGKGGDFVTNAANPGAAGFCSGGGGGGGSQGNGAGVNGGAGGAGDYGGAGGGGGASSQAQGGPGGNGGFGGGGGAGATGTSNGGNGGYGAGGGARGSTGGTPGTGGFFGIGGNGGLDGGGGGSGLGGAIFNDSGTVTVRNSTFFANMAVSGPRGSTAGSGGTSGVGGGGAIWSRNGTLNIIHATFNQNRVTPAPGTGESDGAVGLWTDSGASATLNLRNSILFGNGASECTAFQPGGGGAVTKNGSGNLIGSNSGGSAACPGVAQTADPQLGPLLLNPPGNTPTMAIPATSPAFNNADGAQGLGTDQRGVIRPQGAGFDIGAFELQVADLAVTKSCVGRSFQTGAFSSVPVAGDQLICTITVANATQVGAGDPPPPVIDITITDTVPAGTTYITSTIGITSTASFTGALAACTVGPLAGQADIICTGIDLVGNRPVSFQLAFVIPPDYVANTPCGERQLTNVACASLGSLLFDPNPFNNCGIATLLVKESADLVVHKVSKPDDQVRAGQNFTYTIFVDNLGPSYARRVRLTDFTVSGPPGPGAGTFQIVNVLGDPARFDTCNISVPFSTPTQSATINCVLFDAQPSTPNVNDALEPFGNPVTPSPPVNTGRWAITVVMRANDTTDIDNTVRVYTSGDFLVAGCPTGTPDPDTSNNEATDAISTLDCADLQLLSMFGAEVQVPGLPGTIFNSNGITPLPDPACCNFGGMTFTSGRRIQWESTAINAGPSIAQNTRIEVLLPYGATVIENTLNPQPVAGNVPGRCRTEAAGQLRNRVICEYGDLLVGQTASVRFQVLMDPAIPQGTQNSFDAFATSETACDPNLSNNITSIQFDNNVFADLSITKSALGDNVASYNQALGLFNKTQLPNQVTAGELLRYRLTVTHKGPSLARGVLVTDTLPGPAGPIPAVSFVRADPVDGGSLTCTQDQVQRNVIICALGNMAPGDVRAFDITVRVDPSQTAALVNSAVVGSQAPDPFVADNTATNTTTVNAVGDRFVTKRDVPAEARLDAPFEPDAAIAGKEHRYLITIGNDGPSNVVNATLTDSMDFKGTNLPGETFVRCEPLDPDDLVTCTPTAPGGANTFSLTSLRIANDVIFTGGLGTLPAGKSYSFYAVTFVDPGYVLDASNTIVTAVNSEPGAVARNTAVVGATTTDVRAQNNSDTERTAIIAEADLQIVKQDDAAGFLNCDPVQPGGMINYTILVSNTGPSDAAQVYVVDQLPAEFVAVDPAQVTVTVSRGQVVEKRDDGRITILVGNDANNSGVAELGRLNANVPPFQSVTPVVITITAMVRRDAKCGSLATNEVRVETRANNTTSTAATTAPPWPLVITGPAQGNPAVVPTAPRTPTLDPNPGNNRVVEGTTIECPSIQIDKTISFDGKCPGVQGPITYVPGSPVTYCFRITNNGTTYLDTIQLVDTLRTRMGVMTIFTATITSGADPKVPLRPGEIVSRTVTLPSIAWDQCGTQDDTVTVTANPVNSGRTDLACLNNVSATDVARIDVTCAGLDYRLQLPVLNSGQCKSWISVQNVGDNATAAVVVYWGDAGACPPQAAGPLKIECSGLLKPGSAWGFAGSPGTQLPAGTRSAMVYSLNATNQIVDANGVLRYFNDVACTQLFFDVVGDSSRWVSFDVAYRTNQSFRGFDFGKNRGEPLAALVNRACPDVVDPALTDHASYVGVSTDGEGSYDQTSGGYTYYAPLVFAGKGGLSSWLYIQNSGILCSSLELWFKAQDNCLRPILGDVLSVAPGETVHFDPNTIVGPDWVGSVWVRASQPLGMVVDTMGANHFTSYNGVPGDVADDPLRFFSIGAQVNYAPLIYSEYQGWDTAIQVQNLSAIVPAKVKVYFLDRSGDVITTLVDWVCPRGSQTFFLPLIAGLPGNWVGSARIETQEWVTPGSPAVDPARVQSVVMLEKWSDAQRSQRREAAAYNAPTECTVYDWQLGKGVGGTASGSAVIGLPMIAKGNRGLTSEIGITNVVPKPGKTDFVVYLYDQNGLLDYICEVLNQKQVEYLDLNTYGWVPTNFLGSAVISAIFWEHDVFDGGGRFERNLVGLSAVLVERIGGVQGGPDVPGDESKASEGIPLFDYFMAMRPANCPGVPKMP